jgi:peptidoglycan/LPS O-acetylase OafA/YrhL
MLAAWIDRLIGRKRRRAQQPLPWWIWFADLIALILAASGILVLLAGGFVLLVGDIRISVRSGSRLLLWATGLVVARHVVRPRPSLLEGIAGAGTSAARLVRGAGSALWRAVRPAAVSMAGDRSRYESFSLPSAQIVATRTRSRYRADIDGLRGIAVLAVLAFHAHASWAAGGYIGVDIFFVISGFLISNIIIGGLERDRFSIADFYSRRVRRIFPALVVVLAATWLAGWVVLLPDAYQQLGAHIAGGAGFVANIVNWRESGYFDTVAEQKPLLHLWSLGVEEQFYLMWPAVLLLCWRRRLNLVAALGVIAAASFIVNLVSVGPFPDAAFYLPAARVWELALGGLLPVLCGAEAVFPQLSSRRSRNAASAIGVGLITIAIALLDRRQAFPGWAVLLPTIGTFLVIAAGEDGWFNRRVLSNRALVFVGLVSYPLYLWHWPLLTYARLTRLRPLTTAETVGLLGAAFLLAAATYRLVELPVRATARRRLRPAIAGLVAAMVTVAIGGVWTEARRGLPARFDATLAPIASFSYEHRREYREGTCFLSGGQTAAGFDQGCVDPPGSVANPTVVLWGDSHAAHLYPGMRHLQRTHDFRLGQFTASACPPFANAKRFDGLSPPQCSDIYAYVRAAIQDLKPATLVLSAQWAGYEDLSPLAQTVDFVRSSGNPRIVIIGPVPQWTQPLPRVLMGAFARDPLHRIPSRTSIGSLLFVDVDRKLRDVAERLGVAYLSVLETMCNDAGCLTRTGERPDALTAWDDSHLTTVGSDIVMDAAARLLFDDGSQRGRVASTH